MRLIQQHITQHLPQCTLSGPDEVSLRGKEALTTT
jgi:hypothetical protein